MDNVQKEVETVEPVQDVNDITNTKQEENPYEKFRYMSVDQLIMIQNALYNTNKLVIDSFNAITESIERNKINVK